MNSALSIAHQLWRSTQTKQVKELKPNNPRAIKRGEKQVDQYCKECNKEFGKGHKGTVETYEP